jgi:hypothetical protein
MQNYLAAATVYGFARGLVRTSDMRTHNGKSVALPGTKAVCTLSCAAFAPFLLPVYMANDLNRFYIAKNNLKLSEYNYRDYDTHLTTILFE